MAAKRWAFSLAILVCAFSVQAAPIRMALMDFTDQSGGSTDTLLGGKVDTGLMAEKGVLALSKALVGNAEYVLIDRRDFMNQMQKTGAVDQGKPVDIKPSYIQAAQALKADAVLRGVLESFSVGKDKVNQGGYQAEFVTVSVRVMIEAVDAVDGTVMAMSEGVTKNKLRQTANQQTELGEDEMLQMMQAAINGAVPELLTSLSARVAQNGTREKVMLAMSASENPAMVEIDGILVGTTPFDSLDVYKGDHVLTVSRPGYVSITKRLVLSSDTKIDVPMLRTDLTAEERKQILEGSDMRVYVNEGGKPDFVVQTIE